MKKRFKRIFSFFMIVGMLFQALLPMAVFAVTQDGNKVAMGGNPIINGSTLEYTNGDVTVKLNGENVAFDETASFSVTAGDTVIITLSADDGAIPSLYNIISENDRPTVALNEADCSYTFTIGNANNSTLTFLPSFDTAQSGPTAEVVKFDFTMNGESFTNISVGDTVLASDDFNMDEITEFYITRIAIDGGDTYTYSAGEYSYELLDSENRKIFEVRNFTKISDNSISFGLEIHNNDILTKDIAANKTKDDYLGLYITNLSIVKEQFRGVEVSTSIKPDNYDFTKWNGADLSGTTKSNPGKVTAYYGEDTISFNELSSSITEISLVDDGTVPSSAVEINNETGEITILSNYYNEIPLKIELEDGTIGYITVNRIGIFIGNVNAGNDTFYHGATMVVSGNLDVDTDKNRIAAVFYHEDTTTYNDYDLIVNLTYKDGSTETVIAEGVGDIHNSTGNIVGSDYILWKGDIESSPVKVSVIAVKKGTISSDSTSFSGAAFGSGAGVLWERN